MATESAKAGKYELLFDRFRAYDDEQNSATSSFTDYSKGDVVTLTAEQAERLTTGPRPAFGKPGEVARQLAASLQAQADAAKAQADAATARAAEADKAAK